MSTASVFALRPRSICAHCLPGPTSTHEPSLPSLSPSVIMSSVPTMGLLSLAVTFLSLARFLEPAGTRKSGRLPLAGCSRLGTLRGTGVPTKRGRGNCVFKTTLSCPSAAVATTSTVRTVRAFAGFFIIFSGLSFFGRDGKPHLRGNGLVCFVDSIFAAESFIAGAVQFCCAADGVEKVLQVWLMRRLIEKYRDLILRQLRGFSHIHFRGVCRGDCPGADIALLSEVVP